MNNFIKEMIYFIVLKQKNYLLDKSEDRLTKIRFKHYKESNFNRWLENSTSAMDKGSILNKSNNKLNKLESKYSKEFTYNKSLREDIKKLLDKKHI